MPILTDLLNRYLGSGAGADTGQLADDFHQVAQNVPTDVLGKGLAAAFGSDQTPEVGQMVSQMFGASSPEQRAAMLNQLGGALGPAGATILGSLFGPGAATTGAAPTITPEQAARVDPQQIQAVVTQAQQHNPGIVDSLSGFYAQHPGLVKTLGSAALAIMLGKISEHMKTS
ncbi:MAG: hypothetical protein GXC76_00345 [Rhodanobacteraceae bacterium]|jgi:hypothetical protein|nr:hypothetical protein [Rhodanobacteraceae bacterium]